jgi:hypothetical protein
VADITDADIEAAARRILSLRCAADAERVYGPRRSRYASPVGGAALAFRDRDAIVDAAQEDAMYRRHRLHGHRRFNLADHVDCDHQRANEMNSPTNTPEEIKPCP